MDQAPLNKLESLAVELSVYLQQQAVTTWPSLQITVIFSGPDVPHGACCITTQDKDKLHKALVTALHNLNHGAD